MRYQIFTSDLVVFVISMVLLVLWPAEATHGNPCNEPAVAYFDAATLNEWPIENTFEVYLGTGGGGILFGFAGGTDPANAVEAINTMSDVLELEASIASANPDRVKIESLEAGSWVNLKVTQVCCETPALLHEQAVGGEPTYHVDDWGTGFAPGDINCDGIVDTLDLNMLLGEWGECADADDCAADVDGDGSVGVSDLTTLLSQWGWSAL